MTKKVSVASILVLGRNKFADNLPSKRNLMHDDGFAGKNAEILQSRQRE